eukprot:NODE_8790_length_1469_cov_8.434426.p1 GENE.NODE_8790_length_1469_cov_8.434426~~NODE_8790_length_1469_cov_8.434426.p1  ORF type:complete len:274 (+),score=62.61 NODE_8790_length_1469_cov_8.434426:223-1044(+)
MAMGSIAGRARPCALLVRTTLSSVGRLLSRRARRCSAGLRKARYTDGPVRLAVFDFDQTLTVFHVFGALAGWDQLQVDASAPRLQPPHALTEQGQLARVRELDLQKPFREGGGFATAAFGGHARVAELRRALVELHAAGLELVVCTKGFVGPVQHCLGSVGLGGCFSMVYGRVDGYGMTEYDRRILLRDAAEPRSPLLGSSEAADWRSKASLIQRIRAKRGLARHEACLIEDDIREVFDATRHGGFRALHVEARRGLEATHLQELRKMAGITA